MSECQTTRELIAAIEELDDTLAASIERDMQRDASRQLHDHVRERNQRLWGELTHER